MGKLNQVIAVVAGKKSRAAAALTEAYHKIQKPPLFDGISRTYQPKDEDGEKLPSETKLIQTKCGDLIREISDPLDELYNIVATQEWWNCMAKANVEVNGTAIIHDVPVDAAKSAGSIPASPRGVTQIGRGIVAPVNLSFSLPV